MTNSSSAGKRGGRRPGAGAPKRNLNALKHGRHSAQLRALLLILQTPAVHQLLARLMARQARRHSQRRDAAAVGLWLRHLNSDLPPLTSLPPLNRPQIRLFAQALVSQLKRPPEQSTETALKGPFPDSPAKKKLQHNQTPLPPTPFPPPGAGSPRGAPGAPAMTPSLSRA